MRMIYWRNVGFCRVSTELGGRFLEKDRYERFSQMIMGATKSIYRIKHKRMVKYDLTSTHTACLRLLYDNPSGLTKKEIADNCDMDKAQITRIVKDLVEKEYVKADGTEKAYNRKFFLSQMGREITEDINEIVLAVNEYVSGDIPISELEQFYKTFETINTNLRKAEDIF